MNDELRKQFEKVDRQFEGVLSRFDDLDGHISKVSTANDERYHKLMDALADIAKQYADHTEDHDFTDIKLQRHDKWIHQLAESMGVKLSTE